MLCCGLSLGVDRPDQPMAVIQIMGLAWETLIILKDKLAALRTDCSFITMKYSSSQYCFASRKLNLEFQTIIVNDVFPVKFKIDVKQYDAGYLIRELVSGHVTGTITRQIKGGSHPMLFFQAPELVIGYSKVCGGLFLIEPGCGQGLG